MLSLGALLWPQVRFLALAPAIHDGIVEGFETFGPFSDRPEDDWDAVSSGVDLFVGNHEDGRRLASAEVHFDIQYAYDWRMAETYTATYAFDDGDWHPIRVERTTGWGDNLVTEEEPIGFWLPHLRLSR